MELFERKLKIFKNRDVLFPTYTPKRILFRDDEITQISLNFSYALTNSTPSHMLLLGLPGTGKTATTLFVANKLKEKLRNDTNENVAVSYTVSGKTSYSTLLSLADELEIYLPARGLSFKEIWNRFKQEIGDRILIAIIDEIDLMIMNDGRDFLYYFSRNPKSSIIGISNIVNILDHIKDPRVRSSFSPQIQIFGKYDAEHLKGILEERARDAFFDNVIDERSISLASALAAQRGGDARFAVDILLKAGERVIIQNKEQIDENLIYEVIDDVETLHIKRAIEKLPTVHRQLLLIVSRHQGLSPSLIYDTYNKSSITPLTQRRLGTFLSELELFGLLRIEKKGKGRGKGLEYKVFLTEPPQLLRRILEA